MDGLKQKSVAYFILGITLLIIGTATKNTAVWIIGLVLVGFSLLSARKSDTK